MTPGERRSGRMGTLEVEEGPFTVTDVRTCGTYRYPRKLEQVRVRMLTGELQGEPRQWLASWVEEQFPTVRS